MTTDIHQPELADGSISTSVDRLPDHRGRLSVGWLALIALGSLILRWVYLRQIEDVPFFHHLVGDAARYWEWAGEIIGRDWIGSETFYQAPLYPYFLAAVRFVVGDDLFTVRLVQAVLGSLSCVFIAIATTRLTGRNSVGILAGLMLAFSPQAVFYGALIQKSILDLFLTTGLILLIAGLQSKADSGESRWAGARFFSCGMVLALLTLSRENALLLAAPLLIWIFVFFRVAKLTKRWASAGMLILGLGAVWVPVAARNFAVGGVFAVTTVQMGPNFYIGNHDGATGRYVALVAGHETPVFERSDARQLAEQALGRRLSDQEVSRYWLDRSLDYIRSNTGAWLRLMWTKWMLVWNRYEVPDTESLIIYTESSAILRWLDRLFHFGILAPLALMGAMATWSRRRDFAVFYGMVGILALATATFYVLGRYRFPLVPLLILPAAATLQWISTCGLVIRRPAGPERASWSSIMPSIKPIFAGLIAAIFCSWPLNPERELDAMAYSNVGTILAQQGNFDGAIQMFRRAADGNPASAEPHYNLGLALAMIDRHVEAVAAFQRAKSIAPDLVHLEYNLAVSLENIGQFDEAVACYRSALINNPEDIDARAALIRLTQPH